MSGQSNTLPFVIPQPPNAPSTTAPVVVHEDSKVTPSATTPKPVAPTLQQPKGQAVTDNKPMPRKNRKPGNQIIGAKLLVQYKAEDGTIHEAVTTIDPESHVVQGYTLDIQEKHAKTKDPETGAHLGFEDTGERTLIFKLKYHEKF